MMRLPWLPGMNTGISRLDADHRHLFEVLNELTNCVELGNLPAARVLTEQFITHMAEHYAQEEAAMDRFGYPERAAHKAEHDRSRFILLQLDQSIRSAALGEAAELLAGYSRHYFRGLLKDDSLLAEFLLEISPAI